MASMWTEAAIYLQNRKAEFDEAGEGTQFNLINRLKDVVETAENKEIKETNNNTLTKTTEQKSLDQARIDFLSKNTPANKAFEEGDYRKADWDEMRWQKFGKPNYESNLLKKD